MLRNQGMDIWMFDILKLVILSFCKNLNITFCILRVDLLHAAEGTLIPKYKSIIIIHDTAHRQKASIAFGINRLGCVGYSIIVQCFQYL